MRFFATLRIALRALRRNKLRSVLTALVPIVKGGRAILPFDLLNPRIFARRLVKMSVQTDANFFGHKKHSLFQG